jgi:hypothetical protein
VRLFGGFSGASFAARATKKIRKENMTCPLPEVKETTRTASQNPLDYLSFILYVKKNVSSCDRLRQLVQQHNEVLIQDVDNIQTRPAWLKGVPTVVKLPSREVLTGTRAMDELVAFSQGLQGVSALDSAKAAAAPLQGGAAASVSFDELFSLAETELTESLQDARYQDGSREKKHDTTLEEVMRRRGATLQRAEP